MKPAFVKTDKTDYRTTPGALTPTPAPTKQDAVSLVVEHALDLISDGVSLKEAARQLDISSSTLFDQLHTPEFSGRYSRARVLQAEHWRQRRDALIAKLEAGGLSKEDVGAYRAAVYEICRIMGRLHPAEYAEEAQDQRPNELIVTVRRELPADAYSPRLLTDGQSTPAPKPSDDTTER